MDSKYMELVDAGRYTRKWLRFDQTIRNFTSGDLGIPLVVIHLGVTGIFCQSDYLTNTFAKYFLECSANHFMTNIFAHTKPHQYIGLILTDLLVNILAQFVPAHKFMNIRFYL